MRDFTLEMYECLLAALRSRGYRALPFADVMDGEGDGKKRWVVLRHDVDRLPWNSVATARMERSYEMAGTYYFRVVPGAWDRDAVSAIASLGHECGYHYEDLHLAKGNVVEAYRLFREHLAMIRQVVPVRTICMHGSPLSRWDNRDIWRAFNYRENGLTGEPYFDLDFNEVCYITDTGRSWNASNVSVRDKVVSAFDVSVRSTPDLIDAVWEHDLADKLMITVHPQRWCSSQALWLRELLVQNAKNLIKRAIVARRV